MSEYQERHSVSRLIGALPGYIGFDEGGQLIEAVRRKPYSVILLDEIEKAHPDTFNILLQVLDDGRLTDSKGRVVDFKNTIIIMTSNLGSEIIQQRFEEGGNYQYNKDKIKDDVFALLKRAVRPEFLNRIDDIVLFDPLSREDVGKIVQLQLNSLKNKLIDQGIILDATEEALQYLTHKGYDPQFGARPIKRLIQKEVINELSKEILKGNFQKDGLMLIDSFENRLVFRNQTVMS